MKCCSSIIALCTTSPEPCGHDFQVWAYPTTAMQCDWLGERVATVDATRAIKNVIEGSEDAGWGPNAVFRYAGGLILPQAFSLFHDVLLSQETF